MKTPTSNKLFVFLSGIIFFSKITQFLIVLLISGLRDIKSKLSSSVAYLTFKGLDDESLGPTIPCLLSPSITVFGVMRPTTGCLQTSYHKGISCPPAKNVVVKKSFEFYRLSFVNSVLCDGEVNRPN